MRRLRAFAAAIVLIALGSCMPQSPAPATDRSDQPVAVPAPHPADPREIHSIHAPLGIPAGAPSTNDLIFRHSYTASTNDTTRFADWVAYAVTPEWVQDLGDPARNYRTDPFLDDDETLEGSPGLGDYEDAHSVTGYDRGHLVPLGSFHGSPFAEEVNYLSVLAPQIDSLNRGPWRSLESRVRNLVEGSGQTAFVIAGPVYDPDQPMPALPGADEPHTVPTAYWMVVYVPSLIEAAVPGEEVTQGIAAFIVPQRLPDYDGPEDFLASVDSIESMTDLDLFSILDPAVEETVEASEDPGWFEQW